MELDRMYKTILNNMNEQVYVRDLDMNILFINPASERLSGWSMEEAIGKKCYEVFGDEDLACKDVCPVNRAISERLSILHHEGKLRTRSGDVKEMQVSISPLYEGEDVTGAVVVMEDITRLREVEKTNVKALIAREKEIEKRKEIEGVLRESEARLKEAEKLAQLGHWELDQKKMYFIGRMRSIEYSRLILLNLRLPMKHFLIQFTRTTEN